MAYNLWYAIVVVSESSDNQLSMSIAGNILYLQAFGNKLIILNSAKVAHELLDKRSANFSFRPRFTMANEV